MSSDLYPHILVWLHKLTSGLYLARVSVLLCIIARTLACIIFTCLHIAIESHAHVFVCNKKCYITSFLSYIYTALYIMIYLYSISKFYSYTYIIYISIYIYIIYRRSPSSRFAIRHSVVIGSHFDICDRPEFIIGWERVGWVCAVGLAQCQDLHSCNLLALSECSHVMGFLKSLPSTYMMCLQSTVSWSALYLVARKCRWSTFFHFIALHFSLRQINSEDNE